MISLFCGALRKSVINPVKRLRAQSHLVCVPDALRIYEGQPLVRELLVG
jgi:hypothetical protein